MKKVRYFQKNGKLNLSNAFGNIFFIQSFSSNFKFCSFTLSQKSVRESFIFCLRLETGLGRPVKPGPGLVFLAIWKKFYRKDQSKIMNFGPSCRLGPGIIFCARAWGFGARFHGFIFGMFSMFNGFRITDFSFKINSLINLKEEKYSFKKLSTFCPSPYKSFVAPDSR